MTTRLSQHMPHLFNTVFRHSVFTNFRQVEPFVESVSAWLYPAAAHGEADKQASPFTPLEVRRQSDSQTIAALKPNRPWTLYGHDDGSSAHGRHPIWNGLAFHMSPSEAEAPSTCNNYTSTTNMHSSANLMLK